MSSTSTAPRRARRSSTSGVDPANASLNLQLDVAALVRIFGQLTGKCRGDFGKLIQYDQVLAFQFCKISFL